MFRINNSCIVGMRVRIHWNKLFSLNNFLDLKICNMKWMGLFPIDNTKSNEWISFFFLSRFVCESWIIDHKSTHPDCLKVSKHFCFIRFIGASDNDDHSGHWIIQQNKFNSLRVDKFFMFIFKYVASSKSNLWFGQMRLYYPSNGRRREFIYTFDDEQK